MELAWCTCGQFENSGSGVGLCRVGTGRASQGNGMYGWNSGLATAMDY